MQLKTSNHAFENVAQNGLVEETNRLMNAI